MRVVVTLLVVIVCWANAACVSTRTTPIDERTNAWQGKSVVLTNRPSAGFAPMTAGKMMFGLLGAAAMIGSGRKIVAENALEDPAPFIGQQLRDAVAARYGIIPAGMPPVSIDETDVLKLARAGQGADLLFDVQVTGWGFAYKPSLTHYFVILGVKLRVIDVQKQALIAEGFCTRNDKTEKDLPTYDQLLADHATLLKSKLRQDTDACVKEFKEKVLKIPSASAAAVGDLRAAVMRMLS